MKNMWMVRAGSKSEFIDDFINDNMVAIGWELGDLTNVNEAKLESLLNEVYSDRSKISNSQSRGMVWNFIHNFKVDDYVVTYDTQQDNITLEK